MAPTGKLADLKRRSEERKNSILNDVMARQVQQTIEGLLPESERLNEAVDIAIMNRSDELNEMLGLKAEFNQHAADLKRQVNHDLNNLEERYRNVQLDTAQAFAEYQVKLEQGLRKWQEQTEAKMTRRVEFVIPDRPPITVENPHYLMPELLVDISLRQDVALVGPAGSGKTTAAAQVAGMLGLPFYFIACSDMDTPTKWFGFINPTGAYQATQVYRWFTGGGVLLIDEYDNMRSNIGVNLNAMLDNGIGDFPGDQLVRRHPDAICVAAGNTYGRGADRIYRGRNGLDESTLERFNVIDWDYDEDLERRLAGNDQWVDHVQTCRRGMRRHNLQYVISPRASIKGAAQLAAGVPWEKVERKVLFKGWPREAVEKARQG